MLTSDSEGTGNLIQQNRPRHMHTSKVVLSSELCVPFVKCSLVSSTALTVPQSASEDQTYRISLSPNSCQKKKKRLDFFINNQPVCGLGKLHKNFNRHYQRTAWEIFLSLPKENPGPTY